MNQRTPKIGMHYRACCDGEHEDGSAWLGHKCLILDVRGRVITKMRNPWGAEMVVYVTSYILLP